MEIGILIGLILTNIILIFLDSHQRKMFRYTEMQLQDALLSTETRLQDKLLKKIKEVKLLQCNQQSRLQQTEIQLRDALLEKIDEVEHLLKQYHKSTLFDYQSPWWQEYSWLYRHIRDWQCGKMSNLIELRSTISAHTSYLGDTEQRSE